MIAIVAGNVALADCAAPPVTTGEQAICLVRADFKLTWPLTDWAALQPTVARVDESWIVSFVDPSNSPGMSAGAFAVVNAASGELTQRLSYSHP